MRYIVFCGCIYPAWYMWSITFRSRKRFKSSAEICSWMLYRIGLFRFAFPFWYRSTDTFKISNVSASCFVNIKKQKQFVSCVSERFNFQKDGHEKKLYNEWWERVNAWLNPKKFRINLTKSPGDMKFGMVLDPFFCFGFELSLGKWSCTSTTKRHKTRNIKCWKRIASQQVQHVKILKSVIDGGEMFAMGLYVDRVHWSWCFKGRLF